ncbi:MAG: hypothetical protein HZB39_09080 [Planctomycetes bacterium]|nr:hypothetical protein [Planctomycetota bacterium]
MSGRPRCRAVAETEELLDRDELRDDDPEIAGLRALREEFGERVQLVGLLYGDAEARWPALREAGVD